MRRPAINDLVKRGAFQPSLFEEVDLAEITDPAYPGERLMVCRNPILSKERNRRREDLIELTEGELKVIQDAANRPKKPLQDAGEIGKKVGAVLAHYQTGRFCDVRITDSCLSWHRKAQFIKDDCALDGSYVIRTSVGPEVLTAEETVKAYKELSHVETAFRLLKTVDLEIRPIYHALSDRVRAHAFLCMLAYYLEWHMRRDLAPCCSLRKTPRHATPPGTQWCRQPGPRRSPSVNGTRRPQGRLSRPGFPGILKTLATQTQQIVQPAVPKLPTFRRVTPPTPYQQRAFELLQLSAL